MALITAKAILASHDFTSKVQEKRKSKNEFQAYAYRLAHDLNDLTHLNIYMMLAKNIDRSLMERAYSFVIDSNSTEKGRLFLWKIKKVRMEFEKKKNLINFEYDYVLKNMRVFRNRTHKLILGNSDLGYNEDILKDVFSYNNLNYINQDLENEVNIIRKPLKSLKKESNKRILVIGNSSLKLIKYIIESSNNLNVIDISKDLNKTIESKLKGDKNIKKVKFTTKDFFKNSYSNSVFSNIFINNYWHLIPLNSEILFIKEIMRVLISKGVIYLNTKYTSKDLQEWKDYMDGKNELNFFVKHSTKEKIIESFLKHELKLLQHYKIDGSEHFVFQKD